MIPILYSAAETAFESGGLGRLTDTISCAVTEELNGAYELALKYHRLGIHAGDISEGAVIMAAHDDGGEAQPFRIYRVTETLDGNIGILARHISADLSRIPVLPFEADNASDALDGLSENAAVSCRFDFETDITTEAAFGLEVPTSAKAALGSGDGSILGVFGGEVEYDLWTVKLLQSRGRDNGVSIRYGKNLTGLESVRDNYDAYNAVVPFCKTQSGVVMCDPAIVSVGEYTEAVPLDLSDSFDSVPSPEQLEDAAMQWLTENQPWISDTSLTVNFVSLGQTEEYRDYAPLEQVCLGDTVRVEYPEIDVDAQFRVVRTVYNTLEERYSEVTLGREERTVSGMMAELVEKLAEARDIAQEIANGAYKGGTFINGSLIYSPSIFGGEISIGSRTGGGYNFRVDSNGNVTTYGSVHLNGADTKIVAPKIFSDSFSVYPEDLPEASVPSPEGGYNLYDQYYGTLYHMFQIRYDHTLRPEVTLTSPDGARLNIGVNNPQSMVRYFNNQDFTDATVTGLEASGYVKDTDVQAMINTALGR